MQVSAESNRDQCDGWTISGQISYHMQRKLSCWPSLCEASHARDLKHFVDNAAKKDGVEAHGTLILTTERFPRALYDHAPENQALAHFNITSQKEKFHNSWSKQLTCTGMFARCSIRWKRMSDFHESRRMLDYRPTRTLYKTIVIAWIGTTTAKRYWLRAQQVAARTTILFRCWSENIYRAQERELRSRGFSLVGTQNRLKTEGHVQDLQGVIC